MRILLSLPIHYYSIRIMLSRLFGKKKEAPSAETVAEQQAAQTTQNVATAAESMRSLKKSGEDLEKK